MTLNTLATFDTGATAALEHFDKFGAFRYAFPIGDKCCVLNRQRNGKRARGAYAGQVYHAATIETVIERIREDVE